MKKIDYFMAGLILIDIIGIIVATPLLIISIFFAFWKLKGWTGE